MREGGEIQFRISTRDLNAENSIFSFIGGLEKDDGGEGRNEIEHVFFCVSDFISKIEIIKQYL